MVYEILQESGKLLFRLFSQVTIMEMTFAYAVAFNQVPITMVICSTSQILKPMLELRFPEIRTTVVYRSISGDIFSLELSFKIILAYSSLSL